MSQDKRYEDVHKRPQEKVCNSRLKTIENLAELFKILLLSGSAGFGKTTLAHVAARQAGYDVMEINARYVARSFDFICTNNSVLPDLVTLARVK